MKNGCLDARIFTKRHNLMPTKVLQVTSCVKFQYINFSHKQIIIPSGTYISLNCN